MATDTARQAEIEMLFDYDSDADVLYVVFDEHATGCEYVESCSGAILRIDPATHRIASATIPFFSRRVISWIGS